MLRRTTLSGSNPTSMKSHNMRAVLMAFLRHGELSRARLAELTGLSSTTITNLVAEMAAAGLVTELASPQNGSRSVGRPRTPLRLRPEAAHAVGVHISVGHIRIALTDLHGRIVADRAGRPTRALRHGLDTPAEMVLAETANQIEALLAAQQVAPAALIGVGVGASGLVNPQSGMNVLAPNLGWRNVAIRDLLEQRLGLPVVVDNNVRAMALAEARFGAGRDVEVMAFIYARIGVGAGIIVGQQLFRGSGAGAGEIGHITILPDGGEPCRCGNHGCLETLVSEPAILRLAAELASQAPDGLLAQHLRQATAEETRLAAVFAAARAGDAPTLAMLEERGHYTGIALANLVNVLNPNLILLGGLFSQAADLLLPAIETTLRARAFADLGEGVQLRITSFGAQAGMIGAAALALDTLFYSAGRVPHSVQTPVLQAAA